MESLGVALLSWNLTQTELLIFIIVVRLFVIKGSCDI